MKNIFNKKKQDQVITKEMPKKAMKGYVAVKGYYPDINMMVTETGFCKIFKLPDPIATDRAGYEAAVAGYLRYGKDISVQVSHIGGADYMVVAVKADDVAAAVQRFEELGLDCPELSIAEWCDVITAVSRREVFTGKEQIGAVNKKNKPTGSIVPMLQPFFSKPRLDAKGKPVKEFDSKNFDANDVYTRTVLVSSLPEHIYPSLCTEIMKVSDDIVISLFVREIDKEVCLYSIGQFYDKLRKNISKQRMDRMDELLKGEERLLDIALLISVSAEVKHDVDMMVEKIQGVAQRYLADINYLDHQQLAAFRSIVPLGVNFVRANKVVMESDVLGLMPLSWCRHVATGISYGTDLETDKEIFYNRLLAKGSGFILGSDSNIIEKRIIREAEQFAAAGKKVEIYVINPEATPMLYDKYDFDIPTEKLISEDDPQEYKDSIYKAIMLYMMGSGNKKSLSSKNKVIYDEVLAAHPESIEEFKAVISEKDKTLGQKFVAVFDPDAEDYSRIDKPGICCNAPVGKSSRNTFMESTLQLIKQITHTKADVVYVLNADAIVATGALKLAKKMNPSTIFTFTAITKDGTAMQTLYNSNAGKALIEESDFLDITRHSTVDRISLGSILDFDKRQKAVISATDQETGILIAGDTMYLYK